VAILTFFSGFGLGTILTPVMMIFFPVEVAIALTGMVHFFNNVFKLFLVGKKAVLKVVLRFGIPAVLAAFLGAWLLISIPDSSLLFSYNFLGNSYEVYPVKFTIAIILLVFALIDFIPKFEKLKISAKHLPIGGFLSGFFGGLSGNQGALRAAFLIKAGLSKEAFIGTAVIVSAFVDFTRLGVYFSRYSDIGIAEHSNLLIIATLSAITGAYIGNWLLKKITLRFLHLSVASLLVILSILLATGIL